MELVVITINVSENDYHVGCPYASLVAINDSPSSVGIKKREHELATEFIVLKQNYPNPFNSSTQINFYLPTNQHVSLKIYDIKGRPITTPIESELKMGRHQINWYGRDIRGNNMPSGIYFARLFSEDYTNTLKLQMLK